MTTNARLRALVAVAEAGSVRAAALRLFVTESSVSAAITALCNEVGVPLMERNGRGVRLTSAGQRYVGYARTILGLHDEAIEAARAESFPERGLVRLASVTTAGEHVLPDVLISVRAVHPALQVRLEVGPRDQVWPMLANHEVDVVVAGRPPDGLAGTVRAVRPNTLVVVGSPELAEQFAPGRVPWLMREIGSGTRSTALALLAGLEDEPPLLTLGSTGAVVAGAVAGLGVTLVSHDAVAEHIADGRLVELAVPGTPMDRPWHLVAAEELPASAELLVRHVLREGSGWVAPGG